VAANVVLAEAAWGDLDEVYDWVADRTDPDTAQRYVMRILRQCGSLGEFPHRGTPRDDLAEDVRTIAFERRATIAYRVREDVVTILRILHHGRDVDSAFPR
jgi:toxin ParE1/3/4